MKDELSIYEMSQLDQCEAVITNGLPKIEAGRQALLKLAKMQNQTPLETARGLGIPEALIEFLDL